MPDKTVKVSFRILESKMEEIRAFGIKQGHLKESETIRQLLSAGLESKKEKKEEQSHDG